MRTAESIFPTKTSVYTSADQRQPPLVVHVLYRFAIGGLENGLVNLINNMPPERYRHAIVALTDYTDFRDRLWQRDEVPVFALQKRAGNDLLSHVRLWKLLRHLRPHLVHTRNLPGLEYILSATLAGVAGCVHGEHGRDVYDIDGSNFKYNLLRKGMRPFISYYTAVSTDLARWLTDIVKVRSDRVAQIYNGVDTKRFSPHVGSRPAIGPVGFASEGTVVVGTVGRMHAVKDQVTLVQAFLHLLESSTLGARERIRLVMVGDGPLREESLRLLQAANAERFAWLPGDRDDIPQIMRGLDVFVLPSKGEGISNTILEAMASGLPVIATRVGGNPELVEDGQTGMLVPPQDSLAVAKAIQTYLMNPSLLTLHGKKGRKKAEKGFSIEAMVNGYLAVYDAVVSQKE